jgi:MFS family permease
MQTSLFLAQMLGPLFLVMGAGMLMNRDGYREMAEEFLDSRALIYIAGLAAFLPGLAIVLVHNVWVFDWRLIVTLFGWLGLIGGIFRILFPQAVSEIGERMLSSGAAIVAGAIVVLAVGGVLTFYGYFN